MSKDTQVIPPLHCIVILLFILVVLRYFYQRFYEVISPKTRQALSFQ